jgi:hypothetical protein
MVQVVEHLLSKCEALGSIPRTKERKKERKLKELTGNKFFLKGLSHRKDSKWNVTCF